MNRSHFKHPENVAARLRTAGNVPKLVEAVIKARKAHYDALYLVESAMRDARHELTAEQYDALLSNLTDDERTKVASTAPRPCAP